MFRHEGRFPGSLAPQKDEAQGVRRRSEHGDLSLVIPLTLLNTTAVSKRVGSACVP